MSKSSEPIKRIINGHTVVIGRSTSNKKHQGVGLSPELIKRIINGHTVVIGRLTFNSKHWGVGLPPEISPLMLEYIRDNPKAQWAVDNAIDNVFVREVENDYFISEEKEYDLLVDLEDKEFLFWRLQNG